MRGPAAPKDPVEKRPCLYVVLDKTISGSKDPEGVIRDYVYLEGRLKDQVKFTSGDIDEELLDMLPRIGDIPQTGSQCWCQHQGGRPGR